MPSAPQTASTSAESPMSHPEIDIPQSYKGLNEVFSTNKATKPPHYPED